MVICHETLGERLFSRKRHQFNCDNYNHSYGRVGSAASSFLIISREHTMSSLFPPLFSHLTSSLQHYRAPGDTSEWWSHLSLLLHGNVVVHMHLPPTLTHAGGQSNPCGWRPTSHRRSRVCITLKLKSKACSACNPNSFIPLNRVNFL